MQILRPYHQSLKTANSAWLRLAVFAVLALVSYLHGTSGAWAEVADAHSTADFDAYATEVSNNLGVLVDVFCYVAFIMGTVSIGLGLGEMRRLADGSGGGNLAWRQPLTKLFFGGVFLCIPFFTSLAQSTMGVDGATFLPHNLMNSYRLGSPAAIEEQGLGAIMTKGINNIGVLVQVVTVLGFIMGVWFTTRGLQLLKNHIENPSNSPLPESLKRLAVGGVLFSIPMIVGVISATFGTVDGHAGISNTGFNITDGGDGLDGMMVNFISDLASPAYFAINVFSVTAGIVMVFFALQRLVRTAQDGPRGPLSAGTLGMFVIAGLLISFPNFMTVLDNSLTGEGVALTRVNAQFLSEAGADADQKQAALNVFSAVVAFMAVIGMLSIVRGLFMIKTLAEGGQASLMAVTVHLVAGALCVNLGSLINAVQSSLGLSPSEFAVVFT